MWQLAEIPVNANCVAAHPLRRPDLSCCSGGLPPRPSRAALPAFLQTRSRPHVRMRSQFCAGWGLRPPPAPRPPTRPPRPLHILRTRSDPRASWGTRGREMPGPFQDTINFLTHSCGGASPPARLSFSQLCSAPHRQKDVRARPGIASSPWRPLSFCGLEQG